jgi:putative ABC transport system ATP-binding protein
MSDPAADGEVLLRAEQVSKLYRDGRVEALVDVSLEIPRGEYVAIMGPSGSGKSTLLNMLGALDRPTRGEVYFEGQALGNMKSLDGYRSEKLGFVFQSFCLLPTLTASQNVQIPMFETRLTAAQRTEKAAELLELVGMGHRAGHVPGELSVGERQRVAIARALANGPSLLLADEPTGNLDSKTAAGIFDLFEHLHRERRMTIVLVTHDPRLAGRAERIVRMQDGRIVKAPG